MIGYFIQAASCYLGKVAESSLERDSKSHLTECTSRKAVLACNLQHCATVLVARFIKDSVLYLSAVCRAYGTASVKVAVTANEKTFGMLVSCCRTLAGELSDY